VDIILAVELAPEPPAPPSEPDELPDTRTTPPVPGVEIIGWLALGLAVLLRTRRRSAQGTE
jgi:MYXO-CTERM domain-containing protein